MAKHTRHSKAAQISSGTGHASASALDWVVGYHAVLAALEAPATTVELVWIAAGTGGARASAVLAAARAKHLRFEDVPRAQLDQIAGGVAHNGFAARVAPTAFADADELLELASPVCLLGLDGLEDPHNLGAVVRIAAGLGIGGIVVAGPHPPPLGGAAAKVAAGTLGRVPIAHVGSLGDFAVRARKADFWALGADMDGPSVAGVELPQRLLLCVGAEGAGLRAKTRAALDGTIGIPLAAGVDSLNLSVAAGILLWEWVRRLRP
jgi:23S rRNA (guanosine2251-2'-O)-methyltransferase